MARTIKTVMELAKDLGEDREFTRDLASHLGNRTLVHELTALRVARGLTQREIATEMGCTQGRISKIETSDDLDLSFGSIVQYAQALGLRLEITLMSRDATAVDQVEHHTAHIRRLTDGLAHRALADEAIAAGVSQFFDAALNLLQMVQDSAKPPPERVEAPMPMLVVDTCVVDDPDERNEVEGRSSGRSARVACNP